MQAKNENYTSKSVAVTPMMQQYLATKEEHKDCILFYRMGDFYEMFFDDAIEAARVLDISLTKRGKHEGGDIPMCGVPFHACDAYLHKLITSGYKVAICEQMESPEEAKKRGYKAVVRREVVRIVTPGTLVEDELLDAREANYLASLSCVAGKLSLAWIDISTGDFFVCNTSEENLGADLARLGVKELLLVDKLFLDPKFSDVLREHKAALSPQVASMFDFTKTENKLLTFYGVKTLDAYGVFSKQEVSACGSLIEYVELTQKGVVPRLNPPKQVKENSFLVIDAATKRNLELVVTMSGEKQGSLLSVIDKTITATGARGLYYLLSNPFVHEKIINERLDGVEFFFANASLRGRVRELLRKFPDMERALSRIFMGRGSPKDLSAVRDGLLVGQELVNVLHEVSDVAVVARYVRDLCIPCEILDKLVSALDEQVPVLARDGGFIKYRYNNELDDLRQLRDNGRESLQLLRDKYREETGVNTLKVQQNNVLGYFVEVTPNQNAKIVDEKFIHRQTLASAVRYTTDELRDLETKIINAKNQALQLELQIFDELVGDIKAYSEVIANVAKGASGLDVLAGFAQLAEECNYCRPVVDDGLQFSIVGGRHPVVEANISGELSGEFVKNDCNLLNHQRLWLLTGPNMAGKSTFLRQNALIAIMAQMGAFVPADEVHIGCVDKVFSRVGAADDLARGRSTFMVEMVETATILNQSTAKSLVILDEIGRGTATYDGLSIAWSVVEYLHSHNRCRALFATHYHELTALVGKLDALACYTCKVKEWDGNVVFMHEIIEGAADRSYGIHVAKLAGLPTHVIARANSILKELQSSKTGRITIKLADDLPLFANSNVVVPEKNDSVVEGELRRTNIDELTPKGALDLLYKLKSELL